MREDYENLLHLMMYFTAVTNNMRPIAFKRLRQSCVLVDVNQRKAVEIILNSDKIPR